MALALASSFGTLAYDYYGLEREPTMYLPQDPHCMSQLLSWMNKFKIKFGKNKNKLVTNLA